ncbi:MAG: acyl-[acyl-carrier-protein] thioesterase [Paludibacter sp.]|jgi:acyl-ACP thioesterase|nr:acyl-[acyl-carrier-protein] thioesterase [Paludibacter sp.]
MSQASKTYKYNFRIEPQYVDFQSKASLAAIIDILLTTAGDNADTNGFGMRNLNQINSSWVLLRLAVEMNEFPQQYEDIQVETWVEDVGKISTTRNFRITNAENQIIGMAVSIWTMIDITTRRPKYLEELEGIRDFATGISLPMDKPLKIDAVDTPAVDSFKTKYSHIDINGHTNSAHYVTWVSDCFSLDTYKTKKIKRFEINYMHEILFNELVSIHFTENISDDFRFEIKKEGQTACRARIIFEEI